MKTNPPTRMLMIGFDGVEAPAPVLTAIKEQKIAGVILFKRNINSLAALKKLCMSLHYTADYPLLIGIDQEGGRVNRMPPAFEVLPTMRSLADSMSPEDVGELAYNQGVALLELGINLNFAPVMDTDTNPDNPVIGDRSFSSDPAIVSEYGVSYIKGLQMAGVAACAKHFPGHGDTNLDSHTDLPIIEHTIERLNEIEIAPFIKAQDAGVASMMSAHVIYKALDEKYPGTMSKKVIKEILRKRLKYNGVVFTDDLLMSAVKDNYDWLEVINRCVESLCDVLLICKFEENRLEFAKNELQLIAESEKGELIEASCRRINNLAEKYAI